MKVYIKQTNQFAILPDAHSLQNNSIYTSDLLYNHGYKREMINDESVFVFPTKFEFESWCETINNLNKLEERLYNCRMSIKDLDERDYFEYKLFEATKNFTDIDKEIEATNKFLDKYSLNS